MFYHFMLSISRILITSRNQGVRSRRLSSDGPTGPQRPLVREVKNDARWRSTKEVMRSHTNDNRHSRDHTSRAPCHHFGPGFLHPHLENDAMTKEMRLEFIMGDVEMDEVRKTESRELLKRHWAETKRRNEEAIIKGLQAISDAMDDGGTTQ